MDWPQKDVGKIITVAEKEVITRAWSEISIGEVRDYIRELKREYLSNE